MTNTSLLVASKILATRDNKSKVRLAFIYLFKENDVYVIRRKTGLATGKKLEGPVITITKGLVKRTILEQAELRYNSLVKEYLDKGYKDITTEYSTNPEKVEEYVPTIVTNQHGIVKPMLAKIID